VAFLIGANWGDVAVLSPVGYILKYLMDLDGLDCFSMAIPTTKNESCSNQGKFASFQTRKRKKGRFTSRNGLDTTFLNQSNAQHVSFSCLYGIINYVDATNIFNQLQPFIVFCGMGNLVKVSNTELSRLIPLTKCSCKS